MLKNGTWISLQICQTNEEGEVSVLDDDDDGVILLLFFSHNDSIDYLCVVTPTATSVVSTKDIPFPAVDCVCLI